MTHSVHSALGYTILPFSHISDASPMLSRGGELLYRTGDTSFKDLRGVEAATDLAGPGRPSEPVGNPSDNPSNQCRMCAPTLPTCLSAVGQFPRSNSIACHVIVELSYCLARLTRDDVTCGYSFLS